MTKRRSLVLLPFDQSIRQLLDGLKPRMKHGAPRLVTAAIMLRSTKCPRDRTEVAAALSRALKRFGGMQSERFTPADRAQILGAFQALKDQEGSDTMPAANDGNAVQPGPSSEMPPPTTPTGSPAHAEVH